MGTPSTPSLLCCCCLFVGCVLLWAEPARACGPVPCLPSAFLPASGSLPSNAVEFLWRPPTSSSTAGAEVAATVHLYEVENGQRREIASEVVAGRDGYKLVRPAQPVAAGTTLVVESIEPACSAGSVGLVMVEVGTSSPSPTQLGTLTIGEAKSETTMHLPTSAGSCSAHFKVANVKLVLAPDAAARPFVDLMQHALVVDGKKRPQPKPTPPQGAYPSFELGGGLEDVLYALCDKPSDSWTNDIPQGSHRVRWLAILPDGSELESNEVTIQLQCGGDADAGSPQDAAATIASDAAATAMTPPADTTATAYADATTTTASQTSTAATAADTSGARTRQGAEPSREEHGGCSVRARSAREVPFCCLLAASLLFARRTRTRRRAKQATVSRGG